MTSFSFLMRITMLSAVLWLLTITPCFGASPATGLSSPSQAERDSAAKLLRETYKPPARTNWNSLIEILKPGLTKSNVLELLKPKILSAEGGGGSGATESELYRLDDIWLLQCSYRRDGSGGTLMGVELVENLRIADFELPKDFTGRCTSYYVNGQKSGEGSFENGKAEGESIGYYPDGNKSVVQHAVRGVLQGAVIGYYPSGRIKYKGTHKDGAQIGVWTWYKEDGTVESTLDFDKLTKGQ